MTSSQHVYEVRPRKDHRVVDLVCDVTSGILTHQMSDASQPEGLPAEARTRQRDESATELAKALLIINGGGAAALLAFLQAIWSTAPILARPTLYGLMCLSIGAAFAAAFHFFRHQASWFLQSDEKAKWAKYRRLYLASARVSLVLFVVGMLIVSFGVWSMLP
jgi:hypothetical protein